MSKFDIRPEFECQNRISNVKMRYSARIRMSKNEKRKAKNEKRKTKNEKRKTKNKLTSPLIEYRKTKNEKQTNFTLLAASLLTNSTAANIYNFKCRITDKRNKTDNCNCSIICNYIENYSNTDIRNCTIIDNCNCINIATSKTGSWTNGYR